MIQFSSVIDSYCFIRLPFSQFSNIAHKKTISHGAPPPPCHSERSGTTRATASAKANHRRVVEPRRGAGRRNLGTRVRHHSKARPTHQSCAIAALFTAPHHPIHQKLPCTATAAQRTRKIPSFQTGGCRAGKFGEDKGGLEGEGTPSERGVLLPPRS